MYDCIIVGGGISGASFAHRLYSNGSNILMLESSHRLGGCIDTKHYNHFCYESGAHSVYNSYENFLTLIEQLNINQSIIKKHKKPFFYF